MIGADSLFVDVWILAADTVSGEDAGDVDVLDVDTRGLGIGDRFLMVQFKAAVAAFTALMITAFGSPVAGCSNRYG
jgi:hypothetical protein